MNRFLDGHWAGGDSYKPLVLSTDFLTSRERVCELWIVEGVVELRGALEVEIEGEWHPVDRVRARIRPKSGRNGA